MATVEVKTQLRCPRVPNFIKAENGQNIPISDLSDEAMREIAAEWLESLRTNAERQRKTREQGHERNCIRCGKPYQEMACPAPIQAYCPGCDRELHGDKQIKR